MKRRTYMTTMGLLLASVLPAHAAPAAVTISNQSAYTDLVLDDCSVMHTNDFETTWACPGYRGIPVEVTKAGLRFRVSYGLRSLEEKAASQSPPPFNSLGPSIEWRLSNRGGGWTPFATILRYKLDAGDGGKAGEVLVVSRLAAGNTCHIAYVDALANADADVLAEQAADAHGMDFDCQKDKPATVGKFAAW